VLDARSDAAGATGGVLLSLTDVALVLLTIDVAGGGGSDAGGSETGAGDVDGVDAVCVGNGTMSMDVFAVVVGGAGDDGIIDARRLRDTVGGGGISNESSVMRGAGGARDCSSCCRALSVLG
jgi:hypothetical protein